MKQVVKNTNGFTPTITNLRPPPRRRRRHRRRARTRAHAGRLPDEAVQDAERERHNTFRREQLRGRFNRDHLPRI